MAGGTLGALPMTEAPARKEEASPPPVAKELIMPLTSALMSYWSFAMLFVIGHIRASALTSLPESC